MNGKTHSSRGANMRAYQQDNKFNRFAKTACIFIVFIANFLFHTKSCVGEQWKLIEDRNPISSPSKPQIVASWKIQYKASMPVSLAMPCSVYVPSQKKIFVAGGIRGYNGNEPIYSSSIYTYDIRTDSWETRAEVLPYAMEEPFCALGANGNIFITPGIGPTQNGGWGIHNKLIEYNPQTGHFSESIELDKQGIWTTAIASQGKWIYMFGGWSGNAISSIWAYDIERHRISRIASLLRPSNEIRAVTGNDGRIYLVGGHLSNSIQVFDPSRYTLVDLSAENPEFGKISEYNVVWKATGGTIYIAPTNEKTIFIFDPTSTGLYSTYFDLGEDISAASAVNVPNGGFYLIGGQTSSKNISNRILNIDGNFRNLDTVPRAIGNKDWIKGESIHNSDIYAKPNMPQQDMIQSNKVESDETEAKKQNTVQLETEKPQDAQANEFRCPGPNCTDPCYGNIQNDPRSDCSHLCHGQGDSCKVCDNDNCSKRCATIIPSDVFDVRSPMTTTGISNNDLKIYLNPSGDLYSYHVAALGYFTVRVRIYGPGRSDSYFFTGRIGDTISKSLGDLAKGNYSVELTGNPDLAYCSWPESRFQHGSNKRTQSGEKKKKPFWKKVVKEIWNTADDLLSTSDYGGHNSNMFGDKETKVYRFDVR